MRYLTLAITIPLAVFAVLFAVSNTQDVTVGLWPFEGTRVFPLWVFALSLLGGGFLLGALFVWLLEQRTRFRYWRESRRSARLEKELEDLQKKQQAQPASNAPAASNTSAAADAPAIAAK